MHRRVAAVVQWASNRRVAWGLLAAALLLCGTVLVLQQGPWEPAYTDFGQEGDRYTFPLNGKIAQEGGVSYYWARCGHNAHCGPIAFRGDPPRGLDHAILKVPSRDPTATSVALPAPVQADCRWRGDCPDSNTTSITVTTAWGPYSQAPVRAQQAAVGLALMACAGAFVNRARGPSEGARVFVAMSAGALFASAVPLDGTMLWVFGMLLLLPGLLLAGLLSLLSRKWSVLGRSGMVLRWALAAWFVHSILFLSWFPGPPTT